MNLLMLAPDIQERLLFPVEATAMLRERELRPIVTLNLWREQRQYLRKMTEAPAVAPECDLNPSVTTRFQPADRQPSLRGSRAG